MNSIQSRSRFLPQLYIEIQDNSALKENSNYVGVVKREVKNNPFGTYLDPSQRDFTTTYDITRNLPRKFDRPFFLQEEDHPPTQTNQGQIQSKSPNGANLEDWQKVLKHRVLEKQLHANYSPASQKKHDMNLIVPRNDLQHELYAARAKLIDEQTLPASALLEPEYPQSITQSYSPPSNFQMRLIQKERSGSIENQQKLPQEKNKFYVAQRASQAHALKERVLHKQESAMQHPNALFHEMPTQRAYNQYPAHLSSTMEARKKYETTNKLLQNKLGESSTDIQKQLRIIESCLQTDLNEVQNSEAVLREYAKPKIPKWEKRDKSREKETYITSFKEDLDSRGRDTYYAPPQDQKEQSEIIKSALPSIQKFAKTLDINGNGASQKRQMPVSKSQQILQFQNVNIIGNVSIMQQQPNKNKNQSLKKGSIKAGRPPTIILPPIAQSVDYSTANKKPQPKPVVSISYADMDTTLKSRGTSQVPTPALSSKYERFMNSFQDKQQIVPLPAYLHDQLNTQLKSKRKHEIMIDQFAKSFPNSCMELKETLDNAHNNQLEFRLKVPIETLDIKRMDQLREAVKNEIEKALAVVKEVKEEEATTQNRKMIYQVAQNESLENKTPGRVLKNQEYLSMEIKDNILINDLQPIKQAPRIHIPIQASPQSNLNYIQEQSTQSIDYPKLQDEGVIYSKFENTGTSNDDGYNLINPLNDNSLEDDLNKMMGDISRLPHNDSSLSLQTDPELGQGGTTNNNILQVQQSSFRVDDVSKIISIPTIHNQDVPISIKEDAVVEEIKAPMLINEQEPKEDQQPLDAKKQQQKQNDEPINETKQQQNEGITDVKQVEECEEQPQKVLDDSFLKRKQEQEMKKQQQAKQAPKKKGGDEDSFMDEQSFDKDIGGGENDPVNQQDCKNQ